MKNLKDFKQMKQGRELDMKKTIIFGIVIFIIFCSIIFGGCMLLENDFPEQIQSICSSAENVDDLTTKIKTFCNNNGLSYAIDESKEEKGTYVIQIKDGNDISTYSYKPKTPENPLDVDESKLTDEQLKERKEKKAKICSDVNFAINNNKIIDTLKDDLNDIKKDAESQGISFDYEISDKLNNDYVLKTIVGGDIYRNSFKVKKENVDLTAEPVQSSIPTVLGGEDTKESQESNNLENSNNDSNNKNEEASTASINSTTETEKDKSSK